MIDVTELNENPLEKEGWEKRSILDEPRLSEVVKIYKDKNNIKTFFLTRSIVHHEWAFA